MLNIDFENKKSIREFFGNTLVELGREYNNIVVLDADLSSSTQTKLFAKEFPERFFNVGIAEQDLISTAAGLAIEGKCAFAASFAMFITGRAYDQVRNSVCYQNANVKIIGTHGGITVGEDGATHQALEDIALMRNIPNMRVFVPADVNECVQILNVIAKDSMPAYIRLSRSSLPNIYPVDYKFDINKANILKEGTDLTIVSNGDILQEAIKASNILEEKGISAEVISLPVVKPLDKSTIIESAKKTGFVVTIENHSIIGGIGSAIAELLSENLPTRMHRIGMKDTFGRSGSVKDLLKFYNLDAEGIVRKIEEVI